MGDYAADYAETRATLSTLSDAALLRVLVNAEKLLAMYQPVVDAARHEAEARNLTPNEKRRPKSRPKFQGGENVKNVTGNGTNDK